MAYAEKVPSPKGDYWRGRYKDPFGAYVSVRDERGKVMRYSLEREAQKAAGAAETDVEKGTWRDPKAGNITFERWAGEWYAGLDLAASTMANIKRHLEGHLLLFFGKHGLRDIDAALILKWERGERRYGYAPATIRTWRGTLHLILEDAVPRHIALNPATRRRGRGKRSGRSTARRGPERVIASPLGVLLIAERMSILTGRDDEFVMVQTLFWEALRLGEGIGLERTYVRAKSLRVERQLHEVEGDLIRCPPKDDSYGDPDMPPFLRRLLADHMGRVPPGVCPCHGKAYVFRGYGAPRAKGNIPMRDVAAAAGVTQTVAQAALGGKGRISGETRELVLAEAARLGYERDPASGAPAWHWRRSSFEELFAAAASAQLRPTRPGTGKGKLARRGVPLTGEWPGTRVRGANAEARAEFCWLPVADGMTPHGTRHSVKTLMEERRTPEILSEHHLRHDLPGVSAVYRHVTPAMRAELVAMMTEEWEAALDARLEMSPRSPITVVDALLRERAETRKPRLVDPIFPRNSPETPEAVLPFKGRTASDLRRGDRI
jgi:hypothetical protein